MILMSQISLKQHSLSIKEILSPSIFSPHQIHVVAGQIWMKTVPSFLPACLEFLIIVLRIRYVNLDDFLFKTKSNVSLHLNTQDAYSPTDVSQHNHYNQCCKKQYVMIHRNLKFCIIHNSSIQYGP